MIYDDVKAAYEEIYRQPAEEILSNTPDENTFDESEIIDNDGHPKSLYLNGTAGKYVRWFGINLITNVNIYTSFYVWKKTGSERTELGFINQLNDTYCYVRIETNGQIDLLLKGVGSSPVLISSIGTANLDQWEHYIVLVKRLNLFLTVFTIYQNDIQIYTTTLAVSFRTERQDYICNGVNPTELYLDRIYIGLDFDIAKKLADNLALPFRNGDLEVDTFDDDAYYYRTMKPNRELLPTGLLDRITERAAITITAQDEDNIEVYLRRLIYTLSIKRTNAQWFIRPNITKIQLIDDIYQKSIMLEELYIG